jgi:class 3 adenylate cyclase
VVAALRQFQQKLPTRVVEWETEWRMQGLPKTARVGIATGPVYPLKSEVGSLFPQVVDYAGYCINLAVRLQDHCPGLGFIIHQPVEPQLPQLIRLVTRGIKGSLEEPVYAFERDFERMLTVDPEGIDVEIQELNQIARGEYQGVSHYLPLPTDCLYGQFIA